MSAAKPGISLFTLLPASNGSRSKTGFTDRKDGKYGQFFLWGKGVLILTELDLPGAGKQARIKNALSFFI